MLLEQNDPVHGIGLPGITPWHDAIDTIKCTHPVQVNLPSPRLILRLLQFQIRKTRVVILMLLARVF